MQSEGKNVLIKNTFQFLSDSHGSADSAEGGGLWPWSAAAEGAVPPPSSGPAGEGGAVNTDARPTGELQSCGPMERSCIFMWLTWRQASMLVPEQKVTCVNRLSMF